MTLIQLIIKAREKGLIYIATDGDGDVFGFPTKPFLDMAWYQWETNDCNGKYLGCNDSMSTFTNWDKSSINISKLKLTVLEKFNA